EDNDWN
nr:Chain H, PbTRAP [synthetic construct]2PC4_H Chain H, PbTRAP [synthetic construct]